jgi:hypothetical protein
MDQNKIIEICADYESGLYIKPLMYKYHVGWRTIKKILVNNNVEFHSHKRKYIIDESFFETINTEEKAYWLGFLYADGTIHVSGGKYWVILKLAIKDLEHLELFKVSLKSDYLIRHDKKNCVYVLITSKGITEDIIKLGCVPNKSFIIQWPSDNIVPENLKRHFMRGFFDGDGCARANEDINDKTASFSYVSASEQFCIDSQKWLMQNCDLRKNKIIHNKNIYNVKYAAHGDVLRIMHFLYDNSNFFLKRKQRKMILLSQKSWVWGRLSPNTIENVINDYVGGIPVIKICKKYNIGDETIRRLLIDRNIPRDRHVVHNTNEVAEILHHTHICGVKETCEKYNIWPSTVRRMRLKMSRLEEINV